MSDEYCFSEKCQYRHWRSGSMPTHRKGDGCPKPHTPTTGEVEDDYAYNEWDTDAEEDVPRREAFRRWHAAEILRAKAEAWEACASIAEGLIEDGIRPDDAEEHLRNPYRGQHRPTPEPPPLPEGNNF